MKHYLVTRFNIGGPRYHARKMRVIQKAGGYDSYLKRRLELFQKYCLPSVKNQTVHDFRWIILLNSDSPDWFVKELEGSALSVIQLVFVTGKAATDTLKRHIMQELEGKPTLLVTSRLDNDDMVRRDFVEEIHRAVESYGEGIYFLNPPEGCRWREGGTDARRYTHPSSPFVSMVEPSAGFQTVHCIAHDRIGRRFPIHQIATDRIMWIQTIHELNLGNFIVKRDPRLGGAIRVSSLTPAEFGVDIRKRGMKR